MPVTVHPLGFDWQSTISSERNTVACCGLNNPANWGAATSSESYLALGNYEDMPTLFTENGAFNDPALSDPITYGDFTFIYRTRWAILTGMPLTLPANTLSVEFRLRAEVGSETSGSEPFRNEQNFFVIRSDAIHNDSLADDFAASAIFVFAANWDSAALDQSVTYREPVSPEAGWIPVYGAGAETLSNPYLFDKTWPMNFAEMVYPGVPLTTTDPFPAWGAPLWFSWEATMGFTSDTPIPIWQASYSVANLRLDLIVTTDEPVFNSVLTPTCLPGAVLGVGDDIQVLLLTRGGGKVIAELNPTSGSFTRDVDATSTLEMTGVTSGLLGESCCDNWNEVYPWNTEIIVYRDGRDAWCGPVTGVQFEYGSVKVTAADLTAWWDRRVLPADLNFVNVDIATIFETVANAAMSTDPVANFNIATTLTGVLGTRSYMQSDYKYANDLLNELAKTGIDYSAYGRTILCGGEQVPADPYVVLTDEFWVQPPTVSARGNDQATQVIVLGKGVTGVATASTAYTDFYGLLVRTFSENEIEDAASAQSAANTRLALMQDQLYIEAGTGGGLKSTAPITLPELIPGIRIRVDSSASCRQVVADFRLKSVKVGFDGSVSIDLQPLGTVGT